MKTRMFLFLAFIILPLSGCYKYSDYWDLTPQAFFHALGESGKDLQEIGARLGEQQREQQSKTFTIIDGRTGRMVTCTETAPNVINCF